MLDSLKSVSNDGHFTPDAETVLRLCLTSRCSGETQVSNVALAAHALQIFQVRLKSFRNEGLFTLEAEKLIGRSSLCIALGWLKEATRLTKRMRREKCELGWSSSLMKGTLLLKPEQLVFCISHRIAVGWLK
jgi:hypothetical protein